ncbi:ABC transporter permease [Frigidibacter sp. MR17.24]|uniref:ABC transporter permease n=1 Tax=Frigidibacter sp. MR17.24 TaxID=3127345 RepID=UPI003012A621
MSVGIGMKRPAEAGRPAWVIPLAARIEALSLPLLSLLAGLAIFAVFLALQGRNPVDFYALVLKAGFGTAFSWSNTLARAAPLLFAALCVAIPARLGLVIIGGEGAIVLGGVATGGLAFHVAGLPPVVAMPLLALAAALTGATWIGLSGLLRQWRGVNETIASLLLAYIAIALMNHLVEGPLRDPASLNKPSTAPLEASLRVGEIPGWSVHWGLAVALGGCLIAWVLIERTTIGFAARIAGGNIRAAQVQGLPVGRLVVGFTALGGAFAGLAGYFEVSAVHGSANASLAAGYGYTGILIAFLARQNPLALIPVAILLAGFEASSGLVQRRMDLPDATMLVLQGFVFVALLVGDSFQGRLDLAGRLFPKER